MAEPRPDWLRASFVVAGVLVLGVVAAVALRRPGSTTVATGPPAAPQDSAAAGVAPPLRSVAAGPDSDRSAPAADTARTADRLPAPPPLRRGVARYARTWTNVREDRGRRAPAVRVLNPGEAVVVDSLRRGWYRVLADGRTLGYVHRSNLDAVPPPVRP
jgi:hypothetical protein